MGRGSFYEKKKEKKGESKQNSSLLLSATLTFSPTDSWSCLWLWFLGFASLPFLGISWLWSRLWSRPLSGAFYWEFDCSHFGQLVSVWPPIYSLSFEWHSGRAGLVWASGPRIIYYKHRQQYSQRHVRMWHRKHISPVTRAAHFV